MYTKTHNMKKLIIILVVVMPFLSMAQSVSVFVGASTNENTMYGAEFKSKTVGFYVEKYNCINNYIIYVLPTNQLKPPSPDNVLYDGVMFGVNTHIKSIGNIVLSAGIGILNEYVIYEDWSNMYSMTVNQRFAMEISAGQDFNAGDNLIIGVRGGVNNYTNLFGTLSVGYKF